MRVTDTTVEQRQSLFTRRIHLRAGTYNTEESIITFLIVKLHLKYAIKTILKTEIKNLLLHDSGRLKMIIYYIILSMVSKYLIRFFSEPVFINKYQIMSIF